MIPRGKKLEEMRQRDLASGRISSVDIHNHFIDRMYGKNWGVGAKSPRKVLSTMAAALFIVFICKITLFGCANPESVTGSGTSATTLGSVAPVPQVGSIVLVSGQRWETVELDANNNPLARLEILTENGNNYTLAIRIDGNQNLFIVEGSLGNVASVMNSQPGGWILSPPETMQATK